MTIYYKIDKKDFLTYQLFNASQSKQIKKKRWRNKVILPFIYFAMGLLFLFGDRTSLTIAFFSIGILWFFIYPLWERRRYVKHYQGFVKENYQKRFGKTASLEFRNDFIFAKDDSTESKILTTEVDEINEIPTAIFVKLKGGQSFILPKSKIENIEEVVMRLKELANYLKISYNINQNWEWK